MIKGKATIQLFDEKTGEVVRELHEENMITNAVDTILNPPDYIEIGMDSDNDRSFNMLRDFVGNIADTAFRGVIVCRDKIPEDGNNMMLPWTNEEIGHAGIANTNTDTSIGTYNANESGRIENGKGYRHVWDFASDKANGEISCICLTTKDGGTNGICPAEELTLTAALWIRSGRRITLLSGGIFRIRSSTAEFSSGFTWAG